jgi:transposase
MQGRFEGLTEAQFEIFKPLLPPEHTGRGRPYAPFHRVFNSIIWILITGARWCDLPKGEQWAPKSTAHRWLGIWQADGTWEKIFAHILGMAEVSGLIDWGRASVDGSFVPGKGGGEEVEHGYKGKGITIHAIVDGNGMPVSMTSTGAAGDERAQVENLLDDINVQTGNVGRPKKRPDALQGDKGYDSRSLRDKVRRRGISPMFPRRLWPNRKPPIGRPPAKPIDRWKVERTFAWLQKKFRRIVVRWERKNKYWMGFLFLAFSMIWVERILS